MCRVPAREYTRYGIVTLIRGNHTHTRQRIVRLKRLSKDGTLLSIGVDLELAQVLRTGDSFLPSNEPEFGAINTKEPEEIVKYFVHVCRAHVKRKDFLLYPCMYSLRFRGIHDLGPHVNDEQYRRLMDFKSLESESQIEDFSVWVADMGKPQVTSLSLIFHFYGLWFTSKSIWKHKMDSSIACSKMNPDDWDRKPTTTHWTNINTARPCYCEQLSFYACCD